MTPEQLAKSGTETASEQRMRLLTIQRRKRVEQKLCRDCGHNELFQDKVVCERCHKLRSKRGKAFKHRLSLNNQCARCQKPGTTKTLCENCMTTQIATMRLRRRDNKTYVFNKLGGKCVDCNESDLRCLSIDHINYDGKADRNGSITSTWYAKLTRQLKAGIELNAKLQILCFNCHAKKDLCPWWLK